MPRAFSLTELDAALAERGVSDEERHRVLHEIEEQLTKWEGVPVGLQLFLTEDKRVIAKLVPEKE
ncbi:hypothetical protein SEA_SCENTAE_60 [Gordonia phage SCentae]|nr:hypothetical protein SEA_SCENTAE_60 [Gordonia phage SCentae]